MERYGQGSPYLRIKGILSTPEWKAAWNVLSRPDLESHIYIPGVGYINGLQSGNFVESTGNTACDVDTEVGLVLDAAGSVGPELVVNGDFSSGLTGWQVGAGATIANVSDALQITNTGTNGWATNSANVSVSVGKTHQFGVTNKGPAQITFYIRDGVGANADMVGITVNAGETKSGTFVANTTGLNFRVFCIGAAGSVTAVDNVTIREITGTHATQATTANKPILRRGIVNLQQQSNTLATAGWALNNSASVLNYAEAGVGGTLSASRVTSAALVNSGCYIYGATLPQNATVTQAAVVKLVSGASTSCKLGADNNNGFIVINPQTMTITSVGSAVTASSAASLGGGYYLFAWSFVQPATQSAMVVYNNAAVTLTLAVDGTGQFVGALNAQQIIAAGGIPLTTTAPASSQYGIGVPVLGAELVTNGDFSNSSSWANPPNWSISGGLLTATGAANYTSSNQPIAVTAGKQYMVTYTLMLSAGSARAYFTGGTNAVGIERTASGTYSEQITANAGNNTLCLSSAGLGFTGSFDNVSVKEITGYKSLPNSYAWQLDGSNDVLALPGPLFQQADDHCVVVAANPFLLDGTLRRLFTQENGSPTVCEIAGYNVGYTATWRDDAAVATSIATPAIPAGTPVVLSARKVGNTRALRNAGVQAGTDTKVLGPTTLGTVAYIGNRAAGDRQWNGLIYPVIAIKGTVSDAELRVLEVAVASTAGVTIS